MTGALNPHTLLRGPSLSPAAREAILALGASAIEPLQAILRDALEPLRADQDGDAPPSWEGRDPARSPVGGWAPLHAVDLLAELGAIEAIPTMLDLLEASLWITEIHDRILQRLGSFGAAALEPTLALCIATDDTTLRGSLAGVLSELGVKDDRIFEVLIACFEEEPYLGSMHFAYYRDERALPILARAAAAFEPEWDCNDPIGTLRGIVEAHEEMAPLPAEVRARFDRLRALCAATTTGGALVN